MGSQSSSAWRLAAWALGIAAFAVIGYLLVAVAVPVLVPPRVVVTFRQRRQRLPADFAQEFQSQRHYFGRAASRLRKVVHLEARLRRANPVGRTAHVIVAQTTSGRQHNVTDGRGWRTIRRRRDLPVRRFRFALWRINNRSLRPHKRRKSFLSRRRLKSGFGPKAWETATIRAIRTFWLIAVSSNSAPTAPRTRSCNRRGRKATAASIVVRSVRRAVRPANATGWRP